MGSLLVSNTPPPQGSLSKLTMSFIVLGSLLPYPCAGSTGTTPRNPPPSNLTHMRHTTSGGWCPAFKWVDSPREGSTCRYRGGNGLL